MLNIENLNVEVDGTSILNNLNLTINTGEVHAIMGPNGSGKSTLSKVLAGHPDYHVESGDIKFEINLKEKSILEMEADERAREGIFLAFQYPTEVPGVSNIEFLKAAFNAVCEHHGVELMDEQSFKEFVKSKQQLLGVDDSFIERGLNVDFSGGEKKRNEILQMAVLSPRLAILDETDSGLDVDSLKVVGQGVNKLRSKRNSMILITHYQRLLDYIVPDFVHVFHKGRIIKSGDKSLAAEIEKNGFDKVIAEFQ